MRTGTIARPTRLALTAVAAIGLSLAAATTNAQAETTPTPTANGHAPVVTVHRATAADAVSPNSSCAIKEYGYTGYRVCGFDWSSADWGGGNVEYFVVGTNYHIYHIWKGSGGWKSLGGTARSAAPNGVYTYIGNGLGIETIGTDNRWHCNDRRSGNWSGWYGC